MLARCGETAFEFADHLIRRYVIARFAGSLRAFKRMFEQAIGFRARFCLRFVLWSGWGFHRLAPVQSTGSIEVLAGYWQLQV